MSILQLYRLKVLPMLVNQSVTYVGESDRFLKHRGHREHREEDEKERKAFKIKT